MGTNITGIGNANAIGFKSRVTGGMYFPPELKDALVGVWSAYGKSNDSTDRNVIKNKIKDRGGDFELLNFNYKEGSGYGKYEVDFDSLDRTDQSELTTDYKSIKISKIKQESDGNVVYSWGQTLPAINSTRIRVKGLNEVGARLVFIYLNDSDQNVRKTYYSDGTYDLPSSPAHAGACTTNFRFAIFGYKGDCNITIEQIPQFQGAVVTDGVDDLIMSVKTMQEMLEGSTEFTAVSMIHLISPGQDVDGNAYTNYIRTSDNYWVANRVSNVDKTGIYGYSFKQGTPTVINNILGDKNDYTTEKSDIVSGSSVSDLFRAKFSVEGFEHYINGAVHVSSVAWYWTFIAKRVLTEDEINLVIEKYNLDRPGEIVKPDIYYDIKRQKITNENHSSFDDELTDFSGNGHNMKLYNLAWKGGSGIAAKKFETLNDWVISGESTITFVKHNEFSYTISTLRDNYWRVRINNSNYNTKKITIVVSKKCYWFGDLHYRLEGDTSDRIKTVTTLLQPNVPTEVSVNSYSDFEEIEGATLGACSSYVRALENNIEITVTIIPSYKGGLLLDGVDDYGKVTNVPIYKDYTIVAKYQRLTQQYVSGIGGTCPISKSHAANQGAFIMDAGTSNFAKTQCYSFGKLSSVLTIDNSNPEFHYQTKYIFDSQAIVSGDEVDSDSLWLGTFRDRDSRFFNGVIYSLMSFPYSLSEFLIERQINKARAGTLYPSQVEFRPIIPEDENITKIDYFVVNSGTWTVIKPGDYVDVGARIVLNVYTKLPYKVEKVSSPAFTGMSVRHSTELNIFDVEGYIKDKTPQKIKLTLAVNEDIVQWNPAITSNLLDSFTASSWYLNGWDNTLTAGTWIKKTDRVFFKATFKTELYGLETATFGGTECVVSKADNWSDSKNIWDIRMLGTVGDLNQVFDLDVYELIRYEDIDFSTAYPFVPLLQNISWGDKLKVGGEVTYIGFKNILPDLYTRTGEMKLNGTPIVSNTPITIEKVMKFEISRNYALDNNEPKVILSPDRLQIPNSSYRILGYIPDISGHNNHGKLNNFAYAGMSGANGYKQDFTSWRTNGSGYSIVTDSKYILTNEKAITNGGYFLWNRLAKDSFKVKISNMPSGGWMSYRYKITEEDTQVSSLFIREDGIYTLPATIADSEVDFFISTVSAPAKDWIGLTIEQIGEYEGAYCLDGVDDFVTIPTTVGGKQVLMKVNWQKEDTMIYNQNPGEDNFAIYTNDYNNNNLVNAYASRNNGSTYIDSVLNNNILATRLRDVTHNITITNENVIDNTIIPVIGANAAHNNFYAQMALYDFMLFDEISTDDKIKELNEYVGIEGNIVEWNPTITSNIPYKDISTYITTDGITSTPKVGNLYKKGDNLTIGIKPVKDLDEVGTVTVNGVEVKRSSLTELGYYIYNTVLDSTQIIDITIDEYIKYEDIVQPYPSLFTLINYDTEEVYSWGSKLKIGTKFKGNVVNLLPDMYEWQGDVLYNGEPIYWNTTPGVVAKEMVFSWNMPFKYLKTNAPKCIFSPSKLRMPNESYRYLGYIPDISGNGNNGVFNNFAFSKMSGADGYPYDYKSTSDFVAHASNAVLVNSETVKFINVLTQTSFYYKGTSYKGKIKVTGITKAIASGKVRYLDIYSNSPTNNDRVIIDKDGIYDVNIETEDAVNIFFYLTPIVSGTTALDEPVYLEQVGNYEGSICFDGVDDYIKIDTTGGMTMLMKTNVISTIDRILYDQRDINSSGNMYKEFAILTSSSDDVLAYAGRHTGTTYIDGVLNTNVTCGQLLNITHIITAVTKSNLVGTEQGVRIGASVTPALYCKAAVFDFMLFDAKCTDEEIKELNNIVGIEGDYVQKPDYYWDAYGKTNFDADRTTIQQRGVVKGYNFAPFDNELDWYLTPNNGYIDVVSRNGYEITLKNLSTSDYGWYFQNSTVKGFIIKDIPFKVKANKSIRVYWDMHSYKPSGENFGHVINNVILNPNEDTSINLRHLTEEELTELDANKSRMYYLLWFDLSTLAVDEEVTIEMLPVEGGKSLALTNNNFAYDKMSGYGGYSFKSFNDSQDTWNIRGDGTGVEIISRDGYSMTVKKLVQNLDWQISNNEYRYPTVLNKELPFKCKSNKKVGLVWQLKYKTEGATSDTTVTLINQQLTPNVPLEISLPYTTQEELTELGAVSTSVYYLLYFSNTTLEIGEEYTVEMLPLYPNGLLFDGVDDYSKALNIVAPTDYTYILSRELLGNTTGSVSMYSGWFQASGGGAFIADYSINSGGATDGMYGFSFGRNAKVPSLATDKIIYGTTTSVNGTDIIPGSNLATGNSITLGQWDVNYKKMAFYKLFLYPRTIDMLSINMVKNMMEEGGIIDITSKLFTDKYTGDYDFKDFNNDFFIGD